MKEYPGKRRVLLFNTIFMALISIIVFCGCQYTGEQVCTHRRQSWLKRIGYDSYSQEYTGKNVKIAVIDTGIDDTISELRDSVIETLSVVSNSNHDNAEHGTAVAGIIAGRSHSDREASGIAGDSKIISIDVTDDEDGIVQIEDLAAGISLAISKDVDIINISIGCLDESEELQQEIQKAVDRDILVIASAGNYMENGILYPAAYDSVLAVGATDRKGEVISPVGNIDKAVVFLPGESIVAPVGNGQYAGCDGTSFSTAICSGIAALLLEKNNDKETVRNYLSSLEKSTRYNLEDIVNEY